MSSLEVSKTKETDNDMFGVLAVLYVCFSFFFLVKWSVYTRYNFVVRGVNAGSESIPYFGVGEEL